MPMGARLGPLDVWLGYADTGPRCVLEVGRTHPPRQAKSEFSGHSRLGNTRIGGRMRHNVYTRALQCAAQVLGGDELLAHYLGVHEKVLARFMDGTVHLPQSLFLKVVDVLLEPGFAELQQRISREAVSKTQEGHDASRTI